MPNIFDIETRNQIFLERLKASESKEFNAYLSRIESYIRGRLIGEGEFIETKKRLNELLSDIRAFQVGQYEEFNTSLLDDLFDLVDDQAAFEVEALQAVTNADVNSPKTGIALSAFTNNIMQIQDYSGNPLLKPFIKDWSQSNIQAIETKIRQGYSQGQPVSQIVRSIRGTKKNRYRDGVIAKNKRTITTMVHTTVQHASSQARQSSWVANDDILEGYEWVSTLDGRTSQICRSLDGQVFKFKKGPLPPIHPNCRSVTTPVVKKEYRLDGDAGERPAVGSDGAERVTSTDSYYDWLKTQPVAFQNSAIGPTRAKLLRDGGITSEQFAALGLNKSFEPLNLDEMRAKRPEVFEQAGI